MANSSLTWRSGDGGGLHTTTNNYSAFTAESPTSPMQQYSQGLSEVGSSSSACALALGLNARPIGDKIILR
ncbi:unnamed protein product [Protopolystoma xenopodis]|uniref:Uncharacterized protein n=1 Tax=Protopolystoma xenopodis TaxID=117903 RepID=A0A3S5BMT3_9PLAT|nr:unnamed protein product [Protopolystoma xenopodis]